MLSTAECDSGMAPPRLAPAEFGSDPLLAPRRQALPQHPNSTWLAALRGEHPDRDQLIGDLRGYVRRALTSTLRRRSPDPEQLEEMTQEAFAQLLSSLHTFRGDSSLPTWAVAVATRVAFSELRRQEQVRARAVDTAEAGTIDGRVDDRMAAPDAALSRQGILETLNRTIADELTEKQRIAILAFLEGVPTDEIATRTGSNPNAVYKLVHDARRRLREALQRRGITAEAIGDLSTPGEQP